MNIFKILKPIATPITIFASSIVLVSGVLMFFKIKNPTLEEMHSQVGIYFVLGTLMHLFINWKPFTNHLKKWTSYLTIIPIVILFLIIILTSEDKKSSLSPGLVFSKIEQSSFHTVALLFKANEEKVSEKLNSLGVKVANNEQTIKEIAELNKKNPREIISIFANSHK